MQIPIMIRVVIPDLDHAASLYLTQQLLPSLLTQDKKSYACFIEVPELERLEELRTFMQAHDYPIYLIPREGEHYYEGDWKRRRFLDEMEHYIKGLHLKDKDRIAFVNLPMGAVYSLNILETIRNYATEEAVKVLRFKKGYSLKEGKKVENASSFGGFVFLCSLQEYERYFKHYDLIMGFEYDPYKEFPVTWVDSVSYLLLNPEDQIEGYTEFKK